MNKQGMKDSLRMSNEKIFFGFAIISAVLGYYVVAVFFLIFATIYFFKNRKEKGLVPKAPVGSSRQTALTKAIVLFVSGLLTLEILHDSNQTVHDYWIPLIGVFALASYLFYLKLKKTSAK